MRQLVLSIVVALGVVVLSTAASAKDPRKLVVEGKPLSKWLKAFEKAGPRVRMADKAYREAALKLRSARFLVGAHDVVVPALRRRLAKEDDFYAVGSIIAYGPLATEARKELLELEEKERRFDSRLNTALIMVGHDVEVRLKSYMMELVENRDEVPKESQRTKRNGLWVDMTPGLYQPLRFGDRIMDFLSEHFSDGLPFDEHSMVRLSNQLGPMGFRFQAEFAKFLDHERDYHRSQVAKGLLLQKLDAATAKKVFEIATSKDDIESTIQDLACVPAGFDAALPAFFKKLRRDRSKLVAAWATVGLARLLPDEPSLLPKLKSAAKNKDGALRLAGVHGMWLLGERAKPAVADLKKRLADDDMRVRWRAAAALLGMNEAVEDALPAFELILGGPDDQERVAAMKAIEALGPVAKPLAAALEPWTTVPFERLASPAKAALASVKKE